MGKRLISLFVVLVVILSLFTGCGSSSSSDEAVAATYAASAPATQVGDNVDVRFSESVDSKSVNAGVAKSEEKADGETAVVGTGNVSQPVVNQILDQRKIIRNANVSIVVESYDKTYGKIQSMVESTGYGYIQQSNVSKQGTTGKTGMIVVRVDADKFMQTLNSVKGLGEVIDANESTDDVTDKFYDVESELCLLRYEQSRLEEYLKTITNPDVIFKTESRLTDLRHQIEGLTGTLNKMSNLVKLSTITINITEKSGEKIITPVKEKSYWEKLLSNFTDSIKGVVKFIGEVFMLLVTSLPVILLIAFACLILWFFYKRTMKSKVITPAKKNNESDKE